MGATEKNSVERDDKVMGEEPPRCERPAAMTHGGQEPLSQESGVQKWHQRAVSARLRITPVTGLKHAGFYACIADTRGISIGRQQDKLMT